MGGGKQLVYYEVFITELLPFKNNGLAYVIPNECERFLH